MRCFLPAVVLFAVGLYSGALTAQDPGGAWVEILEPSEWRGEGTRGIGIQAGRSIRVVGLAHHPSGVQRVLINGLRATVSPDPSGTVRFVGYVQVDPALVDVEVAVYPHEAPPMVRGFGVRPQPAPSTATAADAASAAGFGGKRWAVIVGVSEYEDRRIPALRFADDDARAMYAFLTSDAAGLGGFDPENVLLLVNEQATFRNLRTALFDFLKGPTEDDIVLIYFAGHGAPDPERLDDLYLLPYDTDVEALAGTAFPMADVTSAVRRTYARDLVVITDACHSAGVGGQAGLREVGLNQINRSFLNQLEASTGGIAVFTASEANQLSREGEQWGGGHGIFTWKILEALRGAADENGDRIVALGEMMEYVRDQVRRETRNAQIPTIGQTAFDRSWPMGIVLAPPGLAAVGPESPTVVAPDPEPEPAIEEEPEPAAVEAPSVASILLDRTELELEAGRTITVNALPRAQDGSWLDGRPVEWSSTDVNVARVDAQGRVTGVSPGQARIAVTSGGISARLPVSVTPSVVDDAMDTEEAEPGGHAEVVELRLERSRIDLQVGEAAPLRAEPLGSDGAAVPGIDLAWETSGSGGLRVDGDGVILAREPGEYTVTVLGGGAQATFRVLVVPAEHEVSELVLGNLVIPGSGQFTLGRYERGGLTLGAVVASVAAGVLITRTSVDCAGPPAGGICPEGQILEERVERPILLYGLGVAAAVTLWSAIDVALAATSFNTQVNETRERWRAETAFGSGSVQMAPAVFDRRPGLAVRVAVGPPLSR